MRHLKIFESFKSEYYKEIQNFHDKYANEIANYLHELSDEFHVERLNSMHPTPMNLFHYLVRFSYKDFEKFKSVAHQGLFDRIIDDYPGTEINFTLKISPHPGAIPITQGKNNNIEDLFPIISSKVNLIETSKTTPDLGNWGTEINTDKITIVILFDIN